MLRAICEMPLPLAEEHFTQNLPVLCLRRPAMGRCALFQCLHDPFIDLANSQLCHWELRYGAFIACTMRSASWEVNCAQPLSS